MAKSPAHASGDYLPVSRSSSPTSVRTRRGCIRDAAARTSFPLPAGAWLRHSARICAALNTARGALLALAAKHAATIVPGYTVGVQAQPISFGHYLLGFTPALSATACGSASVRAVNNRRWARSRSARRAFRSTGRGSPIAGVRRRVENGSTPSRFAIWAPSRSASRPRALTVGTLVDDAHTQYHALATDRGRRARTDAPQHHAAEAQSGRAPRIRASEVLGSAATYLFSRHTSQHVPTTKAATQRRRWPAPPTCWASSPR